MLDDKPFDRFQLVCRIAKVRSDLGRFQPNFRGAILAVDMHVWRLAGFMAVKVHPIWAVSQNRRHDGESNVEQLRWPWERKGYC